jgi:2,3-bisphosphoglycerate-independent phosphoglycerate mutase
LSTPNDKAVVLVVLDGFGVRAEREHNAIRLARTPTFDALDRDWPHTTLDASGMAVGLPEGQMGNSEVGHLNLGAGRVVYQDLVRISRDVQSGAFFANAELVAACEAAKAAGGALHVLGLCSDGGVHSTLAHGAAVVDLARRRGVGRVFCHAFLDGRDTPPKSAERYVAELARAAPVATVTGRYYAMDRDRRWERTDLAVSALCHGEGERADDAVDAVRRAYARGETDEFVKPTVVDPAGLVRDGDAVVVFNFRADRARQLTRRLALDDGRPALSRYVCMTLYDATFGLPVAYPPQSLRGILGEVLAARGLGQLRVAETEKYAHVTYFFNGGVEPPFPGEERVLVPSVRDVATYDLRPQMSAVALADTVVEAVRAGRHAFVLVNFANPDMVGHTGKLEPTIRAVECVDTCVGRIVEAARARGTAVLITADHGNCEQMADPATGQPHTAHTTLPVPLWLVDAARRGAVLRPGRLCDVAPTVLEVLGINPPAEMDGRSLLASNFPPA